MLNTSNWSISLLIGCGRGVVTLQYFSTCSFQLEGALLPLVLLKLSSISVLLQCSELSHLFLSPCTGIVACIPSDPILNLTFSLFCWLRKWSGMHLIKPQGSFLTLKSTRRWKQQILTSSNEKRLIQQSPPTILHPWFGVIPGLQGYRVRYTVNYGSETIFLWMSCSSCLFPRWSL